MVVLLYVPLLLGLGPGARLVVQTVGWAVAAVALPAAWRWEREHRLVEHTNPWVDRPG